MNAILVFLKKSDYNHKTNERLGAIRWSRITVVKNR